MWSRLCVGTSRSRAAPKTQGVQAVSGLAPDEEETYRAMVQRSVEPRTMDRYRNQLAHWDTYLEVVRNNPEAVYPGHVMERLVDDRQRSMRLSHYLGYLVTTVRLRGTALSAAVNGLRKAMVSAGQQTAFFDGHMVSTTRRSLRLTARERAAVVTRAEESRVLPMTLPMAELIRQRYWVEASGDRRRLLSSAAVWIAVGLGFDGGLRISNLARTRGRSTGDDDFRLRASHVTFVVRDLADGAIHNYHPGMAMTDALEGYLAEVLEARIVYTSSKSGTVTRVTVNEATGGPFLDDLLTWALTSGIEHDVPFTSRHVSGTWRELTSRDVATAIKSAAEEMGLDPARYSTRSMRSGFTTTMANLGVDSNTRDHVGGWARGSRVPDAHYNFASLPGALSRARTDGAPAPESTPGLVSPSRMTSDESSESEGNGEDD